MQHIEQVLCYGSIASISCELYWELVFCVRRLTVSVSDMTFVTVSSSFTFTVFFITAKPFTTGKAVILWIVFCSIASGDEQLEFVNFIHLVASFVSFHSKKENCWEEASSVLCIILKVIKGLDSFKTVIMDCFSFSNAFLSHDSAEPVLFSHLCGESMFHL